MLATTYSSPSTELYNPRAFIPHAASLRQAFAHCARFPTAASRRSLGRISVPVWLVVLSDQLPVVALVSHDLNQQADRPRAHPSPADLSRPDHAIQPEYPVLAPVSRGYPRVRGRLPTCYAPVRH